MGKMFHAVDKNYSMAMQYKYTWNTLQNFGQFRDKRIWKNFTYFIDWMEKNFDKKKFFTIMGKSYDLEDEILYRIQKTDDEKKDGQDRKINEAWLMSNIFRHVENSEKEKNPIEKFTGIVEFTKLAKVKEEGDSDVWTPPEKNENGEDVGIRKEVGDIKIVVYESAETRKPRRYEKDHGWNDNWTSNDADCIDFKKKWAKLKKKNKIPGWYHFNPDYPTDPGQDHNMVKAWDETIFNFLKDKEWKKKIGEKDGKNVYKEQSKFVVNCSDLLGIGGEAVVIKKSVKEKVGEVEDDREYEALKIIPIMKHNFEAGKVEELEKRVDARHTSADPEKIFKRGETNFRRIPGQENETMPDRMDGFQPPDSKETKFSEDYLKASENHEMTDQDVELAENNGTEFRHDSLMEYSNIQLDFIKVFNIKVFVMVIGMLRLKSFMREDKNYAFSDA